MKPIKMITAIVILVLVMAVQFCRGVERTRDHLDGRAPERVEREGEALDAPEPSGRPPEARWSAVLLQRA